MSKVVQQYENSWVDVTDGRNCVCCDCGMTHREEYAILDGRILQKVHVDKRLTSIYRRANKMTKTGVFAKKGRKK